jgi:hypothetical protein
MHTMAGFLNSMRVTSNQQSLFIRPLVYELHPFFVITLT